MIKKIKILLLVASVFCFNNIKAQITASVFSTPKLSPPIPEAFSLFKFTDIPVSNTTGIPSISIPIYVINSPYAKKHISNSIMQL